MSSKLIAIILALVLVVGVGVGFAVGHFTSALPEKMLPVTVFAAGSLTSVLGTDFYPQFENYTGINVAPTFGGSVSGASEVDTGAPYDVYISAAAGVIPQYMFPNKTANWMVIFASNEMAITWLNSSLNISTPYWFESLTSPGIKVGVSNASLDPSGFQAIEMIKLAGLLYTQYNNTTQLGKSGKTIGQFVRDAWNNDSGLYGKYNKAWNGWFGPNGTLDKDGMGNGYPANYSLALYYQMFNYSYRHGDLVPTTEEYGLDAYLKTGAVDYALTYRSQAINQKLYYFQNANGGNGLSGWINLGNTSGAEVEFYGAVTTAGPGYSNIGDFPGGPILYSATIVSSSKNTNEAQQLIYYLITSLGDSLLKKSDFNPIGTPYLYSLVSGSPSFLNGITVPIPSYMPTSSYKEV